MNFFKTCAILVLTLANFSCSTVKVVTDSNNKSDFTNYETFSFMSWQKVSDEMFSDADKKLIKDSFISEFERRGFKSVSSQGDMQVSVYLVTSEETAFSGYNDYVGGRSTSYSHYMGGWGYGYSSGNTSKQQSKLMGTLILNVYDGKNKQIWQAIATGAIKKNLKSRDKSIPGKVSTVMRRFPSRPK